MRKGTSGLLLAVAALATMIQGGPACGGNYTFTTLDNPNADHGTFASGVNDAGAVVGHYVTGFVNQGFLYQNGQYTTVQVNGGNATPTSLNNAGTIAGFFSDSAGIHGFTLTSGGTLTTIDDPNAVHGTEVTGINKNGDLVGFYYDGAFTAHGFSLINGTFSTIDYTARAPVPGPGPSPRGSTTPTRSSGA